MFKLPIIFDKTILVRGDQVTLNSMMGPDLVKKTCFVAFISKYWPWHNTIVQKINGIECQIQTATKGHLDPCQYRTPDCLERNSSYWNRSFQPNYTSHFPYYRYNSNHLLTKLSANICLIDLSSRSPQPQQLFPSPSLFSKFFV